MNPLSKKDRKKLVQNILHSKELTPRSYEYEFCAVAHKRTFSKREAASLINSAAKSKARYRREQRYYQCNSCNGWHVTSKEDFTEDGQ